MSLNNIQLQDFIVDELYKDNLLVSPETASSTRRPIPPVAPATPAQPVTPSPAAAPPPAATSQPVTPPPATTTSPSSTTPPPTAATPAAKPTAGASLADIAAAMRKGSPANTTAPQPPASTTIPETHAAAPIPPAGATTTQPYKTLGNHRRKVTILVNAAGIPFLPDNQLNFLTKILEACRMNIGDVAIVNHAAAAVNITALREQLQPSVIILFGLEPTTIRLPINFPVFKLQPYDQCTYLAAPPLEQLVQPSDESRLLKSKLWVCLKSLFDV